MEKGGEFNVPEPFEHGQINIRLRDNHPCNRGFGTAPLNRIRTDSPGSAPNLHYLMGGSIGEET